VAGDELELRISDKERQDVIAQLRDHTADGRLTLVEFDERVEEVFAAKTTRELEHSLRELPILGPPPPDPNRWYRGRVRNEVSTWVGTNAICTGIWAATGGGGFWPIWPLMFTTVGLIGLLIRGAEGEADKEARKAEKKAEEVAKKAKD
jgi:hypothetical protein